MYICIYVLYMCVYCEIFYLVRTPETKPAGLEAPVLHDMCL